MRATGRPRPRSAPASPSACASRSVRKPNAPPGDHLVVLLAREQLHEHAGRRPALVELAGRVQVARAEAGRDGAAERVAQAALQALEQRLALGRGGDERLQADVRAAALGVPEHVAQRARLLGRQLAVAREALEDRDRAVLGLLHVRLVERVDVQPRADERRRDLPFDEERADVGRAAVELQREHRVAGLAQRVERGVLLVVARALRGGG